MVALPTTYPPALKNADWQKKKGLVAKIATGSDGSGIGKLLIALEAAWGKIDWTNFDANNAVKGVAPQAVNKTHLKAYLDGAQAEAKVALPARKLAAQIETDADKVAADWAKHKLIPKAAVAAAKGVSAAAKQLAYDMATGSLNQKIGDEAKALQTKIDKIEAHRQASVQGAKQACDKVIAEAKAIKTPEDWDKKKFQSGAVRNVGVQLALAIKVRPDLSALHAKYKTIASNTVIPDAKTLQKRIDEAVNGAQAIKKAIG